ncbi:hypothetical protein M5K25_000947 [Dendrobium thyrsiflorum]|uniref:THUMP domain-containing protein n=1 Tax=Dendrobium thyrsiflorum TaxID=117978 RepID=A0ABD0WEG7_DENTH
MAAENQPASNNNNNKGKKRRFLPHGKPVRKGLYPLRPGVQGFFITCDGGRERQATNEALNLLESFYEELVHGSDSGSKCKAIPAKPVNKIIKFKDSDSSGDEDESLAKEEEVLEHEEESKKPIENKKEKVEDESPHREDSQAEKHEQENDSTPVKRQCLGKDPPARETVGLVVTKNKPIDELIEDELSELGDRNKRHFVSLDSGCNGCIFVQMHRRPGDPSPVAVAHQMISSAASTKKHMSRFILRVLPAEVTCYASEEDISKSIKPLIEQYFPLDTSPLKFAVLYEARSNTGIERMAIINAVAKSVPQPHKVDLKNPDKTIIVQIAKTICLIGVVEKYKEFAKFNLRQLTSPEQ